MRVLLTLPFIALLAACSAKWTDIDDDGDGVSVGQGDCNDNPDGGGGAIYPDAAEVYYDGVDQNCDGVDDYDKDGDGHADPTGGGLDCWDDPDVVPGDFEALNGFAQLLAADVHPDVELDTWYDGIDADCAENDDFDQDRDTWATGEYTQRNGAIGEDCYDSEDEEYPFSEECPPGARLVPGDIYPGATDEWHDGTDADCAGDNDWDFDHDEYSSCAECDDTDPLIFPNDALEHWYDGTDDNCDLNDGDQDLDGFTDAQYEFVDRYPGLQGDGDCWDTPEVIPAAYVSVLSYQPTAAEVFPGNPEDIAYDDVDQDCAGDSSVDADCTNGFGDFDADCDGQDSDADYNRSGISGLDCDDLNAAISYGAPDAWYDGTDSNCYLDSDYDADGDRYDSSTELDGGDDCDDADPDVNPGIANETCDTPYDDDCDGDANDLDADLCVDFYLDDDRDAFGGDTLRCMCVADGEYDTTDTTDCNDAVATTYPGATEGVGDEVDSNCDGGESCHVDADNDEYRTIAASTVASANANCDDPGEAATSLPATDCNDAVTGIHPGATETVGDEIDYNCDGGETCYVDSDNDEYRSIATTTVASANSDCDGAGEAASSLPATDCDDTVATVYPTAPETTADGIDQDCDAVDTCYTDADGDNYGTAVTLDGSTLNCTTGTGAPVSTDCDDADVDTFPGAASIDSATACMNDDDGDNYGDTTVSALYVEGTDCNDALATISPADAEITNDGIDQDCDAVDTCYTDADSDNYGTAVLVDGSSLSCNTGTGAPVSTDCDDANANTFPGAASINSATSCMNDDDGDNYGDETVTGTVVAGTDCNDALATISPADAEITADGIDQDCDDVDQCYTDTDSDNYGTSVVVDGSTLNCSTGTGSTVSTDCDDGDSDTFPGAASIDSATSCMNDDDGDNYGDETVTGTVVAGTDCNDALATISPADAEITADGIDQDCDDVDQCYTDTDSDNYGTSVVVDGSTLNCSTGTGSTVSTDCDDGDSDTFPGAASIDSATSCMNDDDGDNYGDETVTGSVVAGTDCNDALATISPADAEITTDGIDQDCDDVDQCYTDTDGDNYGTSVTTDGSTLNCSTGTGSAVATDCDDGDADTFPSAASIDSVTLCMNDDDGDNYGDETVTGSVVAGTDCNDALATISPADAEVTADGIDQDCDDVDQCYTDTDGDNYGTSVVVDGSTLSCSTGTGSTVATDCDDGDADTFPGAASLESGTTCMNDDDGDGYGDVTVTGSVVAGTDCSDGDVYAYPGATEYCDGMDNDCDASIADEDGLISLETTGGVWSNVAYTGTAGTPQTLALASTGSYNICDGTYYLKLVGVSDVVTVTGMNGPELTILSANSVANSPLAHVTAGAVTLEGLTLRDGSGTTGGYGGAVFATATTATASPTVALIDCVLTENAATNGGGISASGDAYVTVTDSEISGNTATNGGGIHAINTSEVVLTDTVVEDNEATALGGGLYMQVSTVSCTGTSEGGRFGFLGNIAPANGGAGVYMDKPSTTYGTFTAGACDFGVNGDLVDDNVVDDFYTSTGSGSSELEDNETFTCAAGGTPCTP